MPKVSGTCRTRSSSAGYTFECRLQQCNSKFGSEGKGSQQIRFVPCFGGKSLEQQVLPFFNLQYIATQTQPAFHAFINHIPDSRPSSHPYLPSIYMHIIPRSAQVPQRSFPFFLFAPPVCPPSNFVPFSSLCRYLYNIQFLSARRDLYRHLHLEDFEHVFAVRVRSDVLIPRSSLAVDLASCHSCYLGRSRAVHRVAHAVVFA